MIDRDIEMGSAIHWHENSTLFTRHYSTQYINGTSSTVQIEQTYYRIPDEKIIINAVPNFDLELVC